MKRYTALLLILSTILIGMTPGLAQRPGTVKPFDISTAKGGKVDSAPGTRFGSIKVHTDGTTAYLTWEMEVETANFGFYVFRIDGRGKQMVGSDMLQGSQVRMGGHPAYGEQYSIIDPATSGEAAYVVQAIHVSGSRTETPMITPEYVDDLRSIAGFPNDDRTPDTQSGLLMEQALLPSKQLQEEITALTQPADPVTHKWVIGQAGVRIGINKTGMYRITSGELAAAGFNTASDPTLWQLYVEGNEQAIIVGPGGSYVEFYGQGIDRLESDTQAYYLVIGSSAGKRMRTRVARPSSGTVVSPGYHQVFQLKERTTYNQNILNGDAENFWGRTVSGSPTTLSFTLDAFDTTAANALISVRFQGVSTGAHQVQVTLNGSPLGSVNAAGVAPFNGTFEVPMSALTEGVNTLQMVSVAPGPPLDVSYFDRIDIAYSRKFTAVSGVLSFHTLNSRNAVLDGFSNSNIRVFDNTVEGELEEVTNLQVSSNGQTFGMVLPAAPRGRRFIAFEDSAFLAPSSIRLNDPAMLSDPSKSADLVIISYKDFVSSAETWANYRRGQGFTVEVVNIDEIYDEFNYGVLGADSIKSFLQMTSTTWNVAPRYVLLLGDTTSDPRNYRNFGSFVFVPTRMVDTIYTETGSDEFLADFNGDGLAEMAIGRISARDNATIQTVFAKVQNWEANFVNSLDRGALFAHDRIDGYNFEAMNGRLRAQLPQDMPVTMVHRDEPNAQANLVAAMNTGKFVTNYSGHGAAGVWAASNFFANTVVPQLTNHNNESVYTMLTCLNGSFMLQVGNSLAENLLHSTTGGAVAAWSSTGLTTPDVQELMATRFYNRLGAGEIERLGDLIRDAKSVLPEGSDVRLSWALLGDPMLKVRQPNGLGPVKK